MMDTVRKLLKDRKLILCVDKSKIMIFNRKKREKRDMEMGKERN